MKKEGTEDSYTEKTDENGEIVFKNLFQGKYILTEKNTKEEYKLNDISINVDIEYNKQSEITIENEKIKGCVRIIKQDLENDNVRLAGVQFELYDEDMNLLETLETNESGEAVSQKYPSVNKKYYLKEIKTIEGYVLDSELKEIVLVDNSILDVFIKNVKEPKESKTITIEKEVEPKIVEIEKEPEVIEITKEAEPIYKEVIIGQPRIVKKVVKLPKTGM